MPKLISIILFLIITLDTLHHVTPQGLQMQGLKDCPPLSKDCKPDCVTYSQECPACSCPSGGPSNSPFNQGNNLYETPYSTSLMGMSVARPMMVMSTGTGSMMGLGSRNGPLSWPFFHRGSPVMTYACIKRDIVCPAYCLVEDENGCKSCPCGPANGMGVPVASGHVVHMSERPEKPKQTTDCIATIICMLSCKGYKLGPKGQDGCQTCTCIRNNSTDGETNSGKSKNNTNSGDQSNPFQMSSMSGGSSFTFGSGSGSGSATGLLNSNANTGKLKNDTNSSEQSSPFHVDKMPGGSSVGFGSNSGSGTASASGAGMPSPFSTGGGGDSSGSGGSNGGGFNPLFPGAGMTMDGSGNGGGMLSGGGGGGSGGSGSGCTGPFCTSSSGMTGSGAGGGTGSGSSCTGPSCSAKDGFNPLFPGASMTMDGSGSGSGMPNGGGGGTSIGSASGCSGPFCSSTSSQTTVAKPVKGTSCPNTDLCVRTCKYTVKLGPVREDGCHSCACVMKEVTSQHQKLCDKVVQCITNCKTSYEVGNTKDQDGCPSCVCHEPPTSAPTKVPAQSSCDVITLACMANCRHGYIIESKNAVVSQCPVCKCLPPPTTPAPRPNVYSVLQNCPEAVHCMTSCSHGYSMVTRPGEACPTCTCNVATISNVECAEPLSCPRGCSVGYKCGTDGCPVCECIAPGEVGVAMTTTYLTASLVCNGHFTCINRCPFGYQSGHNGCPSCQCLLPVAGNTPVATGSVTNAIGGSGQSSSHTSVIAMVPASGQHIPHLQSSGSSAVTVTGNGGHSSGNSLPHLPLPDTGHTVIGSHVAGSPGEAGTTDCFGPSCSAPNGLHIFAKQHTKKLSPNQCANILTCVMTCTYGYKLGDMADNGCPECTCLQ